MTPRKRATSGGGSGLMLAVLPAESSKFPHAAQAITDSLSKANVSGVERKQVSKVSLEVVQLSIECVEPTVECYQAVGKSLAANRLLFAQVSGKKRQVKVTVTLFDAAGSQVGLPVTLGRLSEPAPPVTANCP